MTSSSGRQPASYVRSFDEEATLDKHISRHKMEITSTDLWQHGQMVS